VALTTSDSGTLSARIHADLRAAILSGRYAAGDALPSERVLSEELGANRHAIREALKRLQEAGLVAIQHGGATRVLDWRRTGGLGLLLALAREGDVPTGLGVPRATMEMRACVGADAARRCAQRAGGPARDAIREHAAALTAEPDLGARTAHYDALWEEIVDGSGNIAYRLALTTLVAGQRVLELDADLVGAELRDGHAIERLAEAIAGGDADGAARLARDLLERSIPAA
jgi:DNA-binding FadR family transcriptional regulator